MTQLAHVVFTPSGAGCLVQALRNAGRDDQVIACSDDMSFGPINPADSSSRAEWVEQELGHVDWNKAPNSKERLWDETRFPDNRKIAWLTRRSAREYAGFLEWLWRRGDDPCEVVDLTDVTVSHRSDHGPPRRPRLAISLGMLHPDIIASEQLWDLAGPLQTSMRTRYLDLWRRLREENAPLRILEGGNLVSAPISFFDSLLMSYVTHDWQKVARIVGEGLATEWDDGVFQTGDLVLAARVNALVARGQLECRGKNPLEMQFSEVRLPKARAG
jgi:uncharacterized protein DUF3658/uncharacterized protein DUF1835